MSYVVDCRATASGLGGTISFCNSTSCENCSSVVPWANGQCLDSDRAYGSLSYSVQCSPPMPNSVPRAGDFMAAWYAGSECIPASTGSTASQNVVGSTSACLVAPGQPASAPYTIAYKATCDAAGGGVFSACEAGSGCGVCWSTHMPLINLTCPIGAKSPGVRFTCSPASFSASDTVSDTRNAELNSAMAAVPVAALSLLLVFKIVRDFWQSDSASALELIL